MLQRAIVVGASSGIGEALVRKMAESGYRVAAVARRQERLDALCRAVNQTETRAFAFAHDVRRFDETSAVFEQAVSALDGLDCLVYAAGVMPAVAMDEFDPVKDREMIEVNLLGAMAWLDLAAQRFQVQKKGVLCGIGSVAGDRGRKGKPAYGASKAGLHHFLEALRNRLSAQGVRVVTIKPGPVDTPMTQGQERQPMMIPAEKAAEGIVRALESSTGEVYIPIQWMPIMTAIQWTPSLVFRRFGPP